MSEKKGKEIIPTSGAFVVCYRLLEKNFFPEILLIKRRDSDLYELPGGGIDYHLDAKQGSIFKDCAIRECFEESGAILKSEDLILDGHLQQRVKYDGKWLIGIVQLYRVYLHNIDSSFVSAESYGPVFKGITKTLLHDRTISVASRRMIAIFLKRWMDRSRDVRNDPYEGNLGSKVTLQILTEEEIYI